MAHEVYNSRARTAATAATIDTAVGALWNPSTSVRIVVYEVWVCVTAAPAAAAPIYLRRITARGTPGATVIVTLENDSERLLAPPSGALLDTALYTVQPTFVTAGVLGGWTLAAAAGAGLILPFPRGIVVPAGTGLAVVCGNAVAIPAADLVYVWEE